MSDESPQLPEGVTLPQRYKRKPAVRQWFLDGAWDGASNRPFAHDDEQAFVQQYGQAALTADAKGYNEGRAARNEGPSDTSNLQ